MKFRVTSALQIVDPSLEDVSRITQWIIGFLRDQGVSDEELLSQLELASAEGINNAIEHGCLGVADPEVACNLVLSADHVSLAISDPSSFPGWSGEAALPDDPFAEGGRGRFLIEQLTDSSVHELRNGRHVLILKKKLPEHAWVYEPGANERVLNSMTEEVTGSYEMINALIGLGELLATAEDIELFLKLALLRVCDLTGADASYVRIIKSGGLQLQHVAGDLLAAPEEVLAHCPDCVEAKVFETGEEITLLVPPENGDPIAPLMKAAFVAPIFYKSDRRGVLVLAMTDSEKPFFSAAQLKVSRVVGEYLGIVSAISELQMRRESEQRALRELEIAAEIQMSLMPSKFDISEKFDIFGCCQPALKAGGDYFDAIHLEDGALLLVCADVMGKGVSAALFSSMLRTNIRALVDLASDPGKLLTEINENLTPDLARLDMFITVECVWVSPDGAIVREANAGHNSGILRHPDGSRGLLKSQGLPVGIIEGTQYETHEMPFRPHEALIMYTDGIPEASDSNGKFYGDEKLDRLIDQWDVGGSEQFVSALLQDVEQFSNHAPPSDDRTLLTVIRKS